MATDAGNGQENRLGILAAMLLVAVTLVGPSVQAAENDYSFELVSAQPAGSGKTDLTVRLVHVPDRKPVSTATVVDATATMAGMMTADVHASGRQQPGLFHFQAATSMAGEWTLTIAAKVPGEALPVHGVLTFNAAQ